MPVEIVRIAEGGELWATVHNAADMARLGLLLGMTAATFVVFFLAATFIVVAYRK